MDSAALLDLLGNENRRRILRLLARKPCYVTEISEYLGVSPKAVIEHLRKLEEAGLVESHTDDQRRKYFHIARNLRLEVNVSPYGFGTKSAYPASRSLDITTWRYLSLDIDPADAVADDDSGDGGDPDTDDPAELAASIARLEELENELSMAQRWVQGRLTDLLDRISAATDEEVNSRLSADVLRALSEGPHTVAELADRVDASPELVERTLAAMAEADLVRRTEEGWTLA
ncbi:metalloregulator ArsR/SmtB family transcription factor [Halostella salina]|uniref:metalloregulator ArsR/SmtB family transcription factor n=1 Tax=Halostella salina TaxID=1547897 RepID=UPI000EF7EC68|nr:metalloregulator ArsR/SmtB family transcription factor [Halostella salina]